MEAKIFFITMIVSSVIFQPSTALKGGSNAVCTRLVSYMQLQTLIPLEVYKKDEENIISPIKIRTKFKTAAVRAQYYPAWLIEQICCSGYENKYGTCEPRCISLCENGYCAQPNTCACNYGYQQNLHGNVSVCEPTREEPCTSISAAVETFSESSRITRSVGDSDSTQKSTPENETTEVPKSTGTDGAKKAGSPAVDSILGKCENGRFVTPGNCTCNEGYQWSPESNKTCIPICKETCRFGKCTGPDECTCDDGYRNSSQSKYICEPFCTDGCAKDSCTAPNNCSSCISGFQLNSTTKLCDQFCTKLCGHGFCKEPKTCVCPTLHDTSPMNSSFCEPVCKNRVDGSCEAQGRCSCNEGFTEDKTGNETCVAFCKPEYDNGMCSAKVCTCKRGWGGNSCGQQLLSSENNSSPSVAGETESLSSPLKSNVGNDNSEKPQINRTLPDSTPVSSTQNTTADVIQHVISTDSSHNLDTVDSDSSNQSRTVIGAVLGSLLFGAIVCAAYFVTKKLMKNSRLRRSESMQFLYSADYVELNTNDGENQHILS